MSENYIIITKYKYGANVMFGWSRGFEKKYKISSSTLWFSWLIFTEVLLWNISPTIPHPKELNSGSRLFSNNFRLAYFETSAATGQNVSKAVECLLDKVMLRMEQAVDKTHLPAKHQQKVNGEYQLDEAQGKGNCGCW